MVSYSKFFKHHGLTFILTMHDVDRWTASTNSGVYTATTGYEPGPVAALRQLHILIRPMINEK